MGDKMELIKSVNGKNIKVIIFDFDGTISTLRQGWESIMRPFMIEMISGSREPVSEVIQEVDEYIEDSTGIQTIFQMKWLVKKVKEYGFNPKIYGPWDYKGEYNRRLLNMVNSRLESLAAGKMKKEDFLIKGSLAFLQELKERGYELYLTSGTDHPDVLNEAQLLGVKDYFDKIVGAPLNKTDSSKKAVINHLIEKKGILGHELLVIGDGKVEIALGIEKGAITLGMATDEIKREGINCCKRKRLLKAGAHAIVGDFKNYQEIFEWLN
jgi:phosphoglycolate phosphatase-like HAD superfamily hydrolase